MTEEVMVEESSTQRVYEVGYLLLPSISEQQISEEVKRLKDCIASNKGTLIVEGNPQLQTLAYEIEKEIGTRNESFGSAYFGWVKFEMSPEGVLAFKLLLDANTNILRFILIKTARDAHIPPKPREMKEKVVVKADDKVAVSPTATEEAIDKSIDELVAE